MNEPSTSGEVAISDLSLGLHHFMCSVGRHCALGMRFTVNVVPEEVHDDNIDSQVRWSILHRVRVLKV